MKTTRKDLTYEELPNKLICIELGDTSYYYSPQTGMFYEKMYNAADACKYEDMPQMYKLYYFNEVEPHFDAYCVTKHGLLLEDKIDRVNRRWSGVKRNKKKVEVYEK